MKILRGETPGLPEGSGVSRMITVALGNFDGVHLGHRELLRAARENTDGSGVVSVLWTVKHPLREGSGGMILPSEERLRLVEEAGIDVVLLDDYRRRLADGRCLRELTPEEFVRTILRDALHADRVVCGFNYRFGKNAAGDAALLTALCREEGIRVTVVPPVRDKSGEIISATRIRAMIEAGDMPGVAALLGRPYTLTGTVTEGHHLGRTLGIPTANLILPPELVRPRFGVYAATARAGNRLCRAVTNIGSRPTVNRDGTEAPNAETHLLDFDGDLYGQPLRVMLHRYLREEEPFDSPEELKNAIRRDIDAVRRLPLTGNGYDL